ncbi:MAG: EAL domain-containing protein [Thermus sp.]|uniref:EAL domain-containing protein n=1 Tax=Thermus sp. TaxID=275 RepID=UPI003097591F
MPERLRFTLDLAQTLLRPLPLEERLQLALDSLLREPWLTLEAKGALFLMKGGRLQLVAQRNLDEPLQRLCAQVPLGQCLCGQVAQEGAPLELSGVTEAHTTRYPGMPPHGHAIFPIAAGQRVLGVLNLYLAPGQALSPEARLALEEAAGLLALAVLRERAERAARVLHRGARLALEAPSDLDQAASAYLKRLCALLVEEGYLLAWVGEKGPGGRMVPREAAGAVGYLEGLVVRHDETPEGQGPTGRAIREGRPQVLRDVGEDPRYGPWRLRAQAFGFASGAAFPLWVEGEVWGALNVYAAEPDAFDAEEVALLEDLAGLAGQAMERIRSYARAYQLAQVVEQVPESILLTDRQGRIFYANPAVEAVTGYRPEELLGATPRVFKSGLHPPEFYQSLWRTLEGGGTFQALFLNRRKDGRLIAEYKLLGPLYGPGRKLEGYLATSRLVTREYALSRVQAALLHFNQRFLREGFSPGLALALLQEAREGLLGVGGLALFLKGLDGRYSMVAASGLDLAPWRGRALPAAELYPLALPASQGRLEGEAHRALWEGLPPEVQGLFQGEGLYARLQAGGEALGLLLARAQAPLGPEVEEAFRLLASGLEMVLATEEERKRTAFFTYHDPQTHLPNRLLLEEEAPALLQEGPWVLGLMEWQGLQGEAWQAHFSLAQALLVALRSCLEFPDRLYQLGPGSFALLLQGGKEAALRVEGCLERALKGLPLPPGGAAWLRVALGVALFPEDGASLGELLRHADLALAEARKEGGLAFFNPELARAHRERQDTLALLSAALEGEGFRIHAQPIAELESGKPVALELLLRLEVEGRLVSAGTFIPLAEETGLIVEMDLWLLNRLRELDLGLPLHLNLSPKTLADPRLLETAALLRGRPLEVEVTEYSLAQPGTREVLKALKRLGFGLALDDFGQGYASMNALVENPFDALKVDRAFTWGIGQNPKAEAVLRAALDLARTLGLQAVAEGVETEEQRRWLLQVGYRLGQGYLLGRPSAV